MSDYGEDRGLNRLLKKDNILPIFSVIYCGISKNIYFCLMKKKRGKNDVSIPSPFTPRYEFVYMDKDRGAIKIDVSASCRIYVDAVFNEDRNALSLRSKEMLLWIIGRLRSGEDVVLIIPENYMALFDIASVSTVRKAIRGLIAANMIAKTDVRNVYFINANYFFRGSRIRKWPEQSRPYAYAGDAKLDNI